MNDEWAVIASKEYDYAGGWQIDSCTAYIYQNINDEYIFNKKICGEEFFKTKDGFGETISIDNNYIILSAPNYTQEAAFIYKYENGNWFLDEYINSEHSSISYSKDHLRNIGSSVSISNNIAIIGAKGSSTQNKYRNDRNGIALVFSFSNNQWKNIDTLSIGSSGVIGSLKCHGIGSLN